MIYSIGDIHGRLPQLKSIYAQILADIRSIGDTENTIVFLGDYIDRGKYSFAVLDYLSNLQNRNDLDHVFLLGNHEELFINAVSINSTTPPDTLANVVRFWVDNGGETSYKELGFDNFKDFFVSGKWQKYVSWIQQKTSLMFETDDYIFVHGGLDKRFPISQQHANVILWARFNGKDHYAGYEKMVVHGHTPTREPIKDARRINVDTSAYNEDGILTAVALENRLGDTNNIRFLQTT